MHLMIGGVLFVAIMAITLVLFAGWSAFTIGRLLWGAVVGRRAGRAPRHALETVMCGRDRCRAVNTGAARFCRRCGAPMDGPAVNQRVAG